MYIGTNDMYVYGKVVIREYWATLAEELHNHPPQGDYVTPPPKMAL